MDFNACCKELSWPLRQFRLITAWQDLGTSGRMRFAWEPKTTRERPRTRQFSTAICRAVFLPKRARALGKVSSGEQPAARMMGMIFSGLRILGLGQDRGSGRQTPAGRLVHLGERCPRFAWSPG